MSTQQSTYLAARAAVVAALQAPASDWSADHPRAQALALAVEALDAVEAYEQGTDAGVKAVEGAAAVERRAHVFAADVVRQARWGGLPWADVARAFGITRQGATKRFGR